MKTIELKVKNLKSNYSIIIGKNILNQISSQIRTLCPGAKKIALVVDKNVPNEFKIKLKKYLKGFTVYTFEYSVNEKFKSFINVNKLVEKCLKYNFNRNDVLISLGGGILGDYSAFAASIIKRGISFINIPTTLLAQVDSPIGGKTGVNSIRGKNLIGSFYQPRLVISDVEILKSLPQREFVCGYNNEKYIYDLFAVCNHHGNCNGGHYTACIKNANNKWYLFNDGLINQIQEDKVITHFAYTLFYRRIID